jgi:hypothetical protein
VVALTNSSVVIPAKAGIQYPAAPPGLLDRPPEPVIGPAKGRTRWRAMTPMLDSVRAKSA